MSTEHREGVTAVDAADRVAETDVAIVGMAGRFPGAPDVDALWTRVRSGDDCLTDLSADDLRAAGVDAATIASPEYVRRSGMLADVDAFDPAHFGIGARDAAIMDPQHRQFLMCVWEALESAGYVPERFDGAIGVFGGCGANTYLLNTLLTRPELMKQLGWFLLRHTGNDKDFLTTGVSYRLNLRGPSINVQTACSTSLVAVHLAVQSLLAFECDMAVAGGVTIEFPHGVGYEYHEGEILAPDGRCRAFDGASAGTVLTSGVGVVTLRRAADAVRDGDPILALLKGSAVNNDGARKVGFLAPSVDGHADVVREALAVAGVDARTIGLVDAHGTGTAVGDPIEFAALTDAFRSHTADTGYCRLTSTKPNIGHLDTAAGVASLIKTVQALRHRELPPLANHTAPSPLLAVDTSPFELSGELRAWACDGPRRAGISSLGVGGTNAHVIVEEAPAREPDAPAGADLEIVVPLSARTADALATGSERLVAHLDRADGDALADVAHTLVVGRREHPHRHVVVASSAAAAAEAMRSGDRKRTYSAEARGDVAVAFALPGGGSQYPGMAAGLDARFRELHRVRDEGLALVRKLSDVDLEPLLAPGGDADALRMPRASLPAVFVTEVALARQWMAWGVEPDVLLGHSLGEYAAAHLADVLSYEDAIRLVVGRAALMERVGGERAGMLVVSLGEDDVRAVLPDDLSLAVVNAPDECVVSGTVDAVERFADALAARDVQHSRVPLAAAAHSYLLDPVLDEFAALVRTVELHPPTRRYPSNLTGGWITEAQATDPRYWVDHLRGTVRFADGLATALAERPLVVVELGPGQSLSSYARRQPVRPVAAFGGLRHPADDVDDAAHALGALGRVWAHGVPVDLGRALPDGPRRRLRLPTTPFASERYAIEPAGPALTTAGVTATGTTGAALATGDATRPAAAHAPLRRLDDVADWGWEPTWRDAPAPETPATLSGPWLVVADADDRRADALATELALRGEAVRVVTELDVADLGAARAVCFVAPDPASDGELVARFDRAAGRLLDAPTQAARTLVAAHDTGQLVVVTSGALAVDSHASHPEQSLARGPVLVAAREYPELRTLLVDAEATRFDAAAIAADVLGSTMPVVAHRHGRRLQADVTPRALPPAVEATTFRTGGTYVVTGALGGIGHAIATHLARAYGANLVVVTSDTLPPVDERAAYIACHGADHPMRVRLERLAELERLTDRVLVVTADVADPAALRAALDEAEAAFGRIDGAVHAAGRLADHLIETITADDHELAIGAKSRAAVVLADELERRRALHLVLVSSTSVVLTPAGQTSYVAGNAVLDAMAGTWGDLRVTAVDFGVWAGTGMAAAAARRQRLGLAEGTPVSHPVLVERSPTGAGGIALVGTLDASRDWVVDEHRVASGAAVLPGSAHLDLFLAAATDCGVHGLANVSLLAPLVVPEGARVVVRVTVDAPDARGRCAMRIESDGGTGRAWQLHSEADALPASECLHAAPVFVPPHPDRRATDPLAAPRRHLQLGARWDSVVTASVTGDAAAAHLRLPEAVSTDAGAWSAHPGLVDVATACAVALGRDDTACLYVPVAYDAVHSFGPLDHEMRVDVQRRSAEGEDPLVADVVMRCPEGAPLLVVEGLRLRALDASQPFADAPADVDDDATTAVPLLLALADDAGIRAHEGVDALERVMGSGAARIVVSSVDLDALRREVGREPETATTTATAGKTPEKAASGGSLLDVLRDTWIELLGVPSVGPDDDFFELGGHSLVAIRLLSRVQKATGVRLQLATLFEVPRLGALADHLLALRPELATLGTADAAAVEPAAAAPAASTSRHPSLVPIRLAGERRPFFVVHGAGGNVLNLWGLGKHLEPGRPLFGLQATGIDGAERPDDRIEDMAARYIDAVRSVQPHGPYLLGGYSGGGVVALEMTHQLASVGERVDRVVLFDTVPRLSDLPPALRRYTNALRNALRDGPKAIVPWIRYSVAHRRGTIQWVPEELGLGFGDTSDLGIVNLFEHFSRVIDRYEFGHYDVDALVVKAQKVFPVWPWHYGWKGRVHGKIESVIVPGDHLEMFSAECSPQLAAIVDRYLDAGDP